MENETIIKNFIKSLNNELGESSEYKIACEFNRDEVVNDGTDECFENLKDKAFYLSCELVHIKYKLGQLKEFIEISEKYAEINNK